MGLDWEEGVDLILKIYEKNYEQREWEMWISLYPTMDDKTFVSFSDFKSKLRPSINTIKKPESKEEIISKSEAIKNLHKMKKLNESLKEGES